MDLSRAGILTLIRGDSGRKAVLEPRLEPGADIHIAAPGTSPAR